MPVLIDDKIEKKAFRAGYECITISLLEFARFNWSYEEYKFIVNYIIRDIYMFLREFDDDIYNEYMRRCDMKSFYANSELSPKDVDNAVIKIFKNYPKIIHAYFLSKICHFFLFGIRFNLTSSTSVIISSFEYLLNLHKSYDCWPYPTELRESLYTIYECVAANTWPPNTLIRHLYICLADFYKIVKADLIKTVGGNLPAMNQYYQILFPREYQDILKNHKRHLNAVIFDDSVAFYTYLKNKNPALLQEYTAKSSKDENPVLSHEIPDNRRFQKVTKISYMEDSIQREKEFNALFQEIADNLRKTPAILQKLAKIFHKKKNFVGIEGIFKRIEEIEDLLQKNHDNLRRDKAPSILQKFFNIFRKKNSSLRIEEIEKEYKNLPNIEKIKYVNLANSVTSDEMDYVRTEIAPIFERDMIFKKGFLWAHDNSN